MIGRSASQESRGTVICHDARPHGFSDGDRVVFSDVEGMNELNCQVHSVQVFFGCILSKFFTAGHIINYYLTSFIAICNNSLLFVIIQCYSS